MKTVYAALAASLLGAGVAAFATPMTATVATPKLSVATLNGGHFTLAAQRGHWVIVNYWATWCRPCIKEMPDLSAFVAAHPKVRAIGLAYDDAPVAKVKAFLAKHPVVYPVAQVDTAKPPADFGAPRGLPTTWLIAPDGSVAHKFLGPVTSAELAGIIDAKHP